MEGINLDSVFCVIVILIRVTAFVACIVLFICNLPFSVRRSSILRTGTFSVVCFLYLFLLLVCFVY